MFPDFRYLIHGIFGVWPPEWVSLFKTFGLMVALAFLAATWVMVRELKRKEEEGLIAPTQEEVLLGEAPSLSSVVLNAVLAFIVGFKIGGILLDWQAVAPSPMGYIASLQGSWLGGILAAAVFGYRKWKEREAAKGKKPKRHRVMIHPHQRIGQIVIIAAIAGLAGAKIFNALETWDQFIQDPLGSLLSPAGLTFYGGFITATLVFYFYARRYKIRFAHLADAAAPAIMLAYGIGRMGCQLAGDGDWGIYNSAYVTAADGQLQRVAPGEFFQLLPTDFAQKNPSAYQAAPSWLPRVLVAQNYPHNVNSEGVRLPDCNGEYCAVLPAGVFPTPLYEFVAGVAMFGLMWSLRRRLRKAWQMFGLFMVLSGVERFLIEQIRVNTKYDLGFIAPTQAEIIAVVLFVGGVATLFFAGKRKERERRES